MNSNNNHIVLRSYRLLAIALTALVLSSVVLTGCRKEIGPTYVHVEDPVRHYMPLIQGDELRMLWKIYNDGPNTLIISDIQPACSAIQMITALPNLVPVGDSAIMVFHFSSEENINLANHAIRIFGNIEPDGVVELLFDVTVVPSSRNQADFEERLLHKITEKGLAGTNTRNNAYLTDKRPFDEATQEDIDDKL